MVVRGGVVVVEAVPRGLNYVASMETLASDGREALLAVLDTREAQVSGR
jgi:hypothetical protein